MSMHSWLKIIALLGLLGLTLFAIIKLKDNGLSPTMKDALLIEEPNGKAKMDQPISKTINLCETRVSAIEQKGLFRLEQKQLAWINSYQKNVSLNQVALEKWFAKYCTVDAVLTGGTKSPYMHPLLTVEFVNGKSEPLLVSPTGTFSWQDEIFQSSELLLGLNELKGLLALSTEQAESPPNLK